ncbi:MAG TPA: hypothetical protein VFW19_17050 [Allosphingosinicella sp.]|nr:hypothetical protein [Allosphingosinicella sp.]
MSFLGEIRDAKVELQGELNLEGVGDSTSRTFFLNGITNVTAGTTNMRATTLKISGEAWLDADIIPAGQLALDIDKDAKFGWGQRITDKYPFSRHPATLSKPDDSRDGGKLELLLEECAKRFTSGAAIILNPDYTAPPRDAYTQWTTRNFAFEFPILMSLLVKHGLADEEPMQASGAGKIRLRPHESFGKIRDAIINPPSSPELASFVADARQAIR